MKNSAKISRTSSSLTSASTWTDSAKDTPPTPTPTNGEECDSAPRDYDLTIPSQKAIPNNYECDNDDDEEYDKFEGEDILAAEAI